MTTKPIEIGILTLASKKKELRSKSRLSKTESLLAQVRKK
jgi:hypothetical protein